MPFDKLSDALNFYLFGETSQVAITLWVLIACWVLNMFPEIHDVANISKTLSMGDVLARWAPASLPWDPQLSREDIISTAIPDPDVASVFHLLTPDWPSITTGTSIPPESGLLTDCQL
jgi:hypothetical protein